MSTRWPSFRKIRDQRSAVTRLPFREPGGAGVTMQIRSIPLAIRSGARLKYVLAN
jgi:hypothetical protein